MLAFSFERGFKSNVLVSDNEQPGFDRLKKIMEMARTDMPLVFKFMSRVPPIGLRQSGAEAAPAMLHGFGKNDR